MAKRERFGAELAAERVSGAVGVDAHGVEIDGHPGLLESGIQGRAHGLRQGASYTEPADEFTRLLRFLTAPKDRGARANAVREAQHAVAEQRCRPLLCDRRTVRGRQGAHESGSLSESTGIDLAGRPASVEVVSCIPIGVRCASHGSPGANEDYRTQIASPQTAV